MSWRWGAEHGGRVWLGEKKLVLSTKEDNDIREFVSDVSGIVMYIAACTVQKRFFFFDKIFDF